MVKRNRVCFYTWVVQNFRIDHSMSLLLGSLSGIIRKRIISGGVYMSSSLFSPLNIKGINLKNRIVMPPMASEFATPEGFVTEKNIEYYAKRAEGGAGTIIVEHTFITPLGRYSARQLTIKSDKYIDGLSKIVEAVKKYNCTIGIQITHAGGKAQKALTGEQPEAPSAVVTPGAEEMPREMSKAEIGQLINDFVAASRRAKLAGFDFVEIHGAHAYLLNQFYSPLTNKRTDEYGGSQENRMRLLLEVVKAVRTELGEDFPLFFRLGADDRIEGGLTADEDGIYAAKKLEESGIDVLDISAGLSGSRYAGAPPACYLYMAEAIKPHINIPLIITGRITVPELAEKIINENKADLVGIGRAMLKDPDWANNAKKELNA
jgi:NADPH2 dehydrogenase